MKIALISCVSKKREGFFPAKELYISDFFLKSYSYALKNFDQVFILSAKHGLLKPDDKIRTYNLTLNKFTEKEKKVWSYQVYKNLIKVIDPLDEIYWFAGNNYRKYLMRVLKNKQHTPLKGLGIGKQLKWFKDRL